MKPANDNADVAPRRPPWLCRMGLHRWHTTTLERECSRCGDVQVAVADHSPWAPSLHRIRKDGDIV